MTKAIHPSVKRDLRAFTLVELLVSTAIISLLMVILVQMTGQTSATWRYTTSRAEQFREARGAFDTMTRRISQATLNTYWDYDSYTAPKEFVRRSELRFICGPVQNGPSATRLDAATTTPHPSHGIFFQAPFGFVAKVNSGDNISLNFQGLSSLLNTWGYFVEVNDDANYRPAFITKTIAPLRLRYRLIEFMQPTGAMSIYSKTSPNSGNVDPNDTTYRNYAGFEWFRSAFAVPAAGTAASLTTSHVLAENIIALVILPKLSADDAVANLPLTRRDTALAPKYYYHSAELGAASSETDPKLKGLLNSKHQLPPVLQVSMVALDELSAQRFGLTSKTDDRFGVLGTPFLTDATKLQADLTYDPGKPDTLNSLEKRLIDLGANYRIFTSDVYLRGAKWSATQSK